MSKKSKLVVGFVFVVGALFTSGVGLAFEQTFFDRLFFSFSFIGSAYLSFLIVKKYKELK